MGFTDLVKYFVEGKTNWTFWGYRGGGWQKGNGLRIDHFLTTANVTDLIISPPPWYGCILSKISCFP